MDHSVVKETVSVVSFKIKLMYFGVEHVDGAKTAAFTRLSDTQLENHSSIMNEYLLGPKIKLITADIKGVEWTVCARHWGTSRC